VALRRVDTGEYVLTKAATTDNFNGTLSFTAAELALLNQSVTYTFDFFDSYDGAWGWVDVDDVSIPGVRMDLTSAENRIVKRGSGTLTLGGLLTHDGGTQVEAGLVLANGPVSAAGSGLLTVGDRAVLGGTGVMTNAVLVSARGIVRPGVGVGTLTAAAMAFTNVSALAEMDLSAGGVDRIAVGGALALNGASLHLTRIGGFSPGSGQSFTLATAGSVSGTFNGLPEGALTSAQGVEFSISYAGNAVTLTSTGGARVFATPDTLTRPRQGSFVFPATALLANDGIGAGPGPLTLTAVSPSSTGGGTLALNGATVTYTPGPAGNDSFTYTVSDGLNSATGLVTVIPAARNGIQPVGVAAGLSVLPNGAHRVTFTGTPGVEYAVEWTGDLVTQPVTWSPLGTVVADGTGLIVIDHASPPAGILYYRAVLP
jgi:autotransporter-associated beta strand protein